MILDRVKKLKLNYAVKALSNLSILKLMKSLGAGLDTVSIQEVRMGIMAGVEPSNIIFTPNGVSLAEIEEVAKLGVQINIDNLSILEQFGTKNPSIPVCVRINPHIMAGGNSKISVGHIDSKFGISVHQTPHILRIVENINDEAELDLEITNSDDKIMDIDEPTWMQPQRTGEGGSVIYDPVGTISLTQAGEYNFKNSNSTSTIYIVDDQSVDLQAFQQPGILIAFISCCFGLIILPLSRIVHLLVGKKKVEQRVVIQKMPTDRIPTTDELFLIREGKLDSQNIQGVKPKKSIPPPFTNMSKKIENNENAHQKIGITKKVTNTESEKQNDSKADEDWQTWDSG